MEVEGPEKLTIDLIAACHLPDDLLQAATAQERADACSKLTHVRLDELQLQELDSDVLCQLSACRSLYLQRNKLTCSAALAALPRLTFLALSHNQLQQVEGLQGLTALLFLDISFNLVEQLSYTQLPDSIKYLKVAGNPCCNQASFEEQLFAHLPRLRELDGVAVDHKQPQQTAAAPDAPDTSDESETEHRDSLVPLMGSYLLGMQQLEHQFAPSTPRAREAVATTSAQEAGISSPIGLDAESAAAAAKQRMVGTTHGEEPSHWVTDADCSEQLLARVVLRNSQQPPVLSSEASTATFHQLGREPSNLTSPRLAQRPESAGVRPSSSWSHVAAPVPSATAANSSLAQECSSAGGSSMQHNSSVPVRPLAGGTRAPRVLSRPQSAQNAAYLSVRPKLGGVAPSSVPQSAHAGQQSVQPRAPFGKQVMDTEANMVTDNKRTASKRSATAVQQGRQHKQTTAAAAPKHAPTAAAAPVRKPPAFGSKDTSTIRVVGASRGKTPASAGTAGAPLKQPGPAGQASHASSQPAAVRRTTSSSSTRGISRKDPNSSGVADGSLPSSRRTSAHVIPASNSAATSLLPSLAAGRPESAAPRKLPSLDGSSTAAAKAAAIAASAVDQPLAVLLQPEPLSRPASARRLVPVDHPALSRPASAAGKAVGIAADSDAGAVPATKCVSRGSSSSRGTASPNTTQAGPNIDTTAAAPAASVGHATAGETDSADGAVSMLAEVPSYRRSTAELPMADARASMVLDRLQAVQGCHAPLPAVQNVLAIEASSCGLHAVASSSSAAPAVAALDALAITGRETLSSTVLSIKQRSKQQTQELLQQHEQELVARIQGAQQTLQQVLQQAVPFGRLTGKPKPRAADEQDKQQHLPPGCQEAVSASRSGKQQTTALTPAPTKPAAGTAATQDSSEGRGQSTAAPAMNALATALNGLQGLRSRLGKDTSDVTAEYTAVRAQTASKADGVKPVDLASRVERLQAQLAAANAQLQEAAAAAELGPARHIPSELHPDVVLEDQLGHLPTQNTQTAPLGRIPEDSILQQALPQTEQHGVDVGSSSGHARRSSDDSNIHLNTDVQGMLDRIFKSTLPVYDNLNHEESDAAGIPTTLFTSKLPRMLI